MAIFFTVWATSSCFENLLYGITSQVATAFIIAVIFIFNIEIFD
jgi:hypothetical protein